MRSREGVGEIAAEPGKRKQRERCGLLVERHLELPTQGATCKDSWLWRHLSTGVGDRSRQVPESCISHVVGVVSALPPSHSSYKARDV